MMNSTSEFVSVAGRLWSVRMVWQGDHYGRDDCLTHNGDVPLVEFYDMDSLDNGQFVSRYCASQIDHVGERGLDLMGYEPFWKIDALTMAAIARWVQRQIIDSEATS